MDKYFHLLDRVIKYLLVYINKIDLSWGYMENIIEENQHIQ